MFAFDDGYGCNSQGTISTCTAKDTGVVHSTSGVVGQGFIRTRSSYWGALIFFIKKKNDS